MMQYGAAQSMDSALGKVQDNELRGARNGVRMNRTSLIRLGSHIPLTVFISLLGLFTYWYHRWPLVPWFATALSFNIVVVSAWPLAGGAWLGRDRWDWFPMVSGLLAICCGVSLGLLNYANIEMWVHGEYLNSYEGVLPTEPTQAVTDAGIIRFATGTVVDVSSGAGYRAWPYTYCAAPIVAEGGNTESTADSENDAAKKVVGFWAVGMNCCSSKGDFTCGDAKDSDVHGGVRIDSEALGLSVGHAVGENYRRAIRKAAAISNVQADDSAVMVVWYKDPESVVQKSWWLATLVFALLVVGAGALTAVSHVLLSRMQRLSFSA